MAVDGTIPVADPGGGNSGMAYFAAQLQEELTALLRRGDMLINGDFRIVQRGTSFDAATTPANNDDTYLFDRWVHISDGNDAADVSQDTDGSYKGDAETANKQWGLVQILEEKDCRHIIGGQVSIRFRAKTTSSAIAKLRCAVLAWTGTADTVTSDVVATWAGGGTEPTWATNWTREGTILDLTLTNSYQTATLDGIDIDTASAKQIAVVLWVDDATITVGDTINVEYVSCNAGAKYPAVRPVRPVAEEMTLCSRYYVDANGRSFQHEADCTSGNFSAQVGFPEIMRIKPTITLYSTGSGNIDSESVFITGPSAFVFFGAATSSGKCSFFGSYRADAEL